MYNFFKKLLEDLFSITSTIILSGKHLAQLLCIISLLNFSRNIFSIISMKYLSNKNLSGENIIECKNTEKKRKHLV
jgi:hypothetical protein